ncbi:MAG: septum formation initiator family protein [Bdellovibrionales bacterium]|nr:septum formation initiator family protein [Bdellovibrionales bacterium]
MFSRINLFIHTLIHQPLKLFAVGCVVTFVWLVADGSLWKFWKLQANQEAMKQRMVEIEEKSRKLEFKIHQAKELTYIERQATDQFDYVREGDLIFVFSD